MATLDVTRVLDNPKFQTSLTVYRRSYSALTEYGRVEPVETAETITAVVIPASLDDLSRLPEGDVLKGAVKVYTKSPLTVRAEGRLPDEVQWRGVRYMVTTVDMWHYGKGFYSALCVAQDGQNKEADHDN